MQTRSHSNDIHPIKSRFRHFVFHNNLHCLTIKAAGSYDFKLSCLISDQWKLLFTLMTPIYHIWLVKHAALCLHSSWLLSWNLKEKKANESYSQSSSQTKRLWQKGVNSMNSTLLLMKIKWDQTEWNHWASDITTTWCASCTVTFSPCVNLKRGAVFVPVVAG